LDPNFTALAFLYSRLCACCPLYWLLVLVLGCSFFFICSRHIVTYCQIPRSPPFIMTCTYDFRYDPFSLVRLYSMAYDGPKDRRTWTTLQTKSADLLLKTTLAHKKVRMNRDIYILANTSRYIYRTGTKQQTQRVMLTQHL